MRFLGKPHDYGTLTPYDPNSDNILSSSDGKFKVPSLTGYRKIAEAKANNNSTLDFRSVFTDNYYNNVPGQDYLITIYDLRATANTALRFRWLNGSTASTSNYYYGYSYASATGSNYGQGSHEGGISGAGHLVIYAGTNTRSTNHAWISLNPHTGPTQHTALNAFYVGRSHTISGTSYARVGTANVTQSATTSPFDGIRFFMEAGNISDGVFSIYHKNYGLHL